MTPATRHPPRRPEHIAGFRPGDKVITPLGRHATIVACRMDGYLDARYTDIEWHPTLAEVILQPQTLVRVQRVQPVHRSEWSSRSTAA